MNFIDSVKQFCVQHDAAAIMNLVHFKLPMMLLLLAVTLGIYEHETSCL